MSEFVEVKTQDLSGVALDWAVAQVENPEGFVMRDATADMGCWIVGIAVDSSDPRSWLKSSYAPSTDWSQGGPLVSKYHLDFCCEHQETIGAALCDENGMYIDDRMMFGKTHLIAACRAIVASALGETVSVPKELLKGISQ
jgi:hypothetical protein